MLQDLFSIAKSIKLKENPTIPVEFTIRTRSGSKERKILKDIKLFELFDLYKGKKEENDIKLEDIG